MKKYLLILSSITFMLVFTLLPGSFTSAQFPSFEVYPNGGTAYPTVSSITIPSTPTSNIEAITADATDVSGINSVTAVIKNSASVEKTRATMTKSSGNTYGAAIHVSSWDPDTYTVDIIAVDTLLNSSYDPSISLNAYANVGSFSVGGTQVAPTGLAGVAPTTSVNNDGKITGTTSAMEYMLSSGSGYTTCLDTETIVPTPGTYKVRYAAKLGYAPSPATDVVVPPNASCVAPSCQQTNGAAITVVISESTTGGEINSFSVSPSTSKAGTAVTLTVHTSLVRKKIIFTDQTASTNIGTVITNASGMATIQYTSSLVASVGSHTLTAFYAGGTGAPTKSSTILTIQSAGNCAGANGASICIEPSQTTNLNQISSFSVNPSTGLAGTTVTLTANLGVPRQKVKFVDQTSAVNIGSSTTNSSGVATIQYTISLADSGGHTLAAIYAGGVVPPSQALTTLTIQSAGNCAVVNGASICIQTSETTTPPQ